MHVEVGRFLHNHNSNFDTVFFKFQGDSGGPLISAASVNKRTVSVQFGVVSFGVSSCGVMNVPGIYENVNEHLEWILDNME